MSDFEYRLLGRTGVKVSPFCLGTYNFGGASPEEESIRMIHYALDAGINFIDTANVYHGGRSEEVVGKALAGGKRENVILATKVHFPMSDDPNDRGNSRRHIMMAVEESLKRLKTDWIDLYQLHRPVFDTPQDETLRALDDLVRQGKVRYLGSSTFPAWLVAEGLAISEKFGLNRYVTEQSPYNLLDRRIENELLPMAQRYGLGVIPWSPLAMGMLAGRYKNAGEFPKGSRGATGFWIFEDRISPEGIEKAAQIGEFADEIGMPLAQLALLWVKEQPGITAPIIGPRTMTHLESALGVLEMELDEEVERRLDEIVPPGTAVSNFFNNSGWMKGY
jgi:aryl-alcohol dehydrogenase-like predicted oxidoreductase